MRYVEFECSPCVIALFERAGKVLLEDVPGRTAIIAAEPEYVLTSKYGITERSDGAVFESDPMDVLDEHLAGFRQDVESSSLPFVGGAVGYFSYDLGRTLESVPNRAEADVVTPDYCLGFYDSALIIDLNKKICTAVSWSGNTAALDYWRSMALETRLDAGLAECELVHCPGIRDNLVSNFTRSEYIRAIERVKEYIAAGDVYQVNLTQRFQAELGGTPWELYKALRRINPAPNSCYMELGRLVLASASPETFLTYDPHTRLAVTKPIKGTRPRGKSVVEDVRLARELAASQKDRAENVMIVDMERNDLGRVAKYGSVRVPKLWEIEPHPNVFQMVSTVEAELAEDYGPVDLIRAVFPGGSITGAPKVRAMEIIEELEPHRRGIYTGSAGYIDFTGRMDLNIVIRSFVVNGSTAYFHAGGGIVADSDPGEEYQETLDKISGLRAALRRCEVNI
jgi:para-aminobenzoate synthetase component 1